MATPVKLTPQIGRAEKSTNSKKTKTNASGESGNVSTLVVSFELRRNKNGFRFGAMLPSLRIHFHRILM